MQAAERIHCERLSAVLGTLEQDRERPRTAAELATACGLHYAHETNRRRVRELIAELRENGYRIVAGFRRGNSPNTVERGRVAGELGYWMARDDGEWKAYLESRRSSARFEFVIVRTMATAAGEIAVGQGKLFATANTAWARA